MSIMNETENCPDCKSSYFTWWCVSTQCWQCDACWDDWTEYRLGYRQYDTKPSQCKEIDVR